MNRRAWQMAALGALAGVGCSGASPSSGQTAWMQVPKGAQFIPGEIDIVTSGASPEVHSVSTQNNDVYPGVVGKAISGTVGPGATAIVIGLRGDSGHWVVPVQDPDTNTLGDLTYSCAVSFARSTPSADGGSLTLVVRATDNAGHVGPAVLQPLRLEEVRPAGALVVSLSWDTNADLDLHLTLPSGDAGTNEIWARKPSGLPTGSTTATVDQGNASGYLDVDSNAQCQIDGRRKENIIFPTFAPTGHYTVRVDTFSLCGQATTRWAVQVRIGDVDAPAIQAFGQSTDTDTRFAHGQGAGAFALDFDYGL